MDWQDQFVGREQDLEFLQRMYREGSEGAVRFVVLLAESGYGKTRLIQEFYGWLQSEQKENVYWPNLLPDGQSRRRVVNPEFPQAVAKTDIPWLWWGIPFEKQHAQSHDIGIIRHKDRLDPHVASIALTRFKKTATANSLKKLGELLAGQAFSLVPVLSNVWSLKGNWDTIEQMLKDNEKFKDSDRREGFTTDELAKRHRKSVADELLDAFSVVLDQSNKEFPTVPVIIILDDSHEIDEDSLAFVERLVEKGHLEKWPLLVIAAHWKREWDQAEALPNDRRSPAKHLKELEKRLYLPKTVWEEKDLRAIDLQPILSSALPGLSEHDAGEILERVGGNPLHLQELIKVCFSKKGRIFEDGDPSKGLTPDGRSRLRELDTLKKLVQDRFDSMDEEAKAVLGLGSLQGRRFLHRLTQTLASRPEFEPVLDAFHHDKTLKETHEPLAVTEPWIQDLASLFRLSAFWETAGEWLRDSHSQEEYQGIKAILLEEIQRAVRDPDFEQWGPEEKEDILDLHLRELRPEGNPDPSQIQWLPWAQEVVRQMQKAWDERSWSRAGRLAHDLLNVDGLWRMGPQILPGSKFAVAVAYEMDRHEGVLRNKALLLREFDDDVQILDLVARTIWESTRNEEEVLPIYQNLVTLHRDLVNQQSIQNNLRNLSVSIGKVADIERSLGRASVALHGFQESLKISRRIVSEFGEKPESLRDVSVSLYRVADVARSLGRVSEALLGFQESLKISRRIVSAYGEKPESLLDVTISLDRVADIELSLGRVSEALAGFRESLKIRRMIVSEFGEKPESLRGVSVSLYRVADVELSLGRASDALSGFRESLRICRRIVSEFGAKPESLREVSLNLERVAGIELTLGRASEALSGFQECLKISQRIVSEFGENPESLRDVSVSINKLADLELSFGRSSEALSGFQESLKISQRIVSEFGETPGSLRDITFNLARLADVELSLGRVSEALSGYRESLKIRRRIVTEFGEGPESLSDVTISLARLADIELFLGRASEAHSGYQESLMIGRRIVAEFGENPKSLSDVLKSEVKMLLITGDRTWLESAGTTYRRLAELYPGWWENTQLREGLIGLGLSKESL